MESVLSELEHLRIPFKDIEVATNTFAHIIGHGGFGNVYKGELSFIEGRKSVAIKRLDPKLGQGGPEFWKEITILHRHTHENLITLLGFCTEGGNMILVYEYASKGSLDRHLSSTNFTWRQRLKTCLDAARGLSFLHDAKGTNERIIHRDIKSANILLDENWNAKVYDDMGLSMIAPANQQHTGLVTSLAGTPGYVDSSYMNTYHLTKESDVYSFGVVLFEVLCGRLCFETINGSFVPMWKESYEQNKLQQIIFDNLKQQIDRESLKTYSGIAYKCLQISPKERPTMPGVVKELEAALKYQELYEGVELTEDFKKMILTYADHLNYASDSELKMLLLKGTLLNRGKTWFSLNTDGEHCEMISITECLTSTASESIHYIHSSEYISRFAVGCYEPFGANFKTHVRTQFLSPRITYTVNLVLKNTSKSRYIGLKYKLKGKKGTSYSFLSDEREDGWLTAELYQFTSDQSTVDLEIWFYTEWCPTLVIEGIEFLPLKKVEHEVLMDDKVDIQPISDNETHWEQKLPIDYEDIIKRSKDRVQWKTKKDLYLYFRKGFLISYGEEWFHLAKDGKKCLMLPARAALEEDRWEWKPEPETRFEEVAVCIFDTFGIFCKFSSKMLSPQTTYAAFLVYELPDDYESVDQPPPVQVVEEDLDSDSDSDSEMKEVNNIFLRIPQTPVISWNEKEEKTFNPSSRPKIKSLPKQRSDGWMEVQVHEFQTRATIKMTSICLKFSSYDMSLKGVTLLGLEFRPV